MLLIPPKKEVKKQGLLAEAETKDNLSVVLAVGEGVTDERLKPGVKVYHLFKGEQIQFEGQTVRVLSEDDLVGIVTEDSNG